MRGIRIASCLVLLFCCSCNRVGVTPTETQSTPARKVENAVNGPLRVLVLDDPDWAKKLNREWSALSEHAVEFRDDTVVSFLAQLREDGFRLDTDVVVCPGRLLGELAERRQLRALPANLTDSTNGVFSGIVRKELRWDRRQLAVTFGSPVPMLMYRSDLLPQTPQTWGELDTALDALASRVPDEMRVFSQPLAEGWAARIFLSRAAAYSFHSSRISSFFEMGTMRPRIASQPMVRALESMQSHYHSADLALSPRQAYADFMAGKSAVVIAWPHGSDDVGDGRKVDDTANGGFSIQIAELPGVAEEYQRDGKWRALKASAGIRRVSVLGHDGRVGCISRYAKNTTLASNFLGWASSGEQAVRFASVGRSSAPSNASHLDHTGAWCEPRLSAEATSQYGSSIQAACSRPEVFVSIRIRGHDEYMRILDEGVLNAMKEGADAQSVLDEVSRSWDAVTDRLGREQQILAYDRSLGIGMD